MSACSLSRASSDRGKSACSAKQCATPNVLSNCPSVVPAQDGIDKTPKPVFSR
eukprot:m.239672 g.239672  ORF g.239672 m.239672 type:complete len:53 (-) comp54380_c0_seq8:115-273(-)